MLDAPDLPEHLRLDRELGRGGMAVVYLAHDLRHDRKVALKVLHRELAAALGPGRFQREIQLTARLDHPNVLPVLDSGVSSDRLWYSMPYVDGGSLRARLRRVAQLGIPEAIRIAREVARALEHAHQHGVVHRDIKPENILLSGDRVLVADFGIAKLLDADEAARLTETGLSLGTPAYMSPEQAAGDTRLDGRADVYALGCVLYEMLAGQPPFSGPTPQSIIARHLMDPVPSLRTVRSTVPPSVEAAIGKALAKVPADRYETAGEFAEALVAEPVGGLTAVSPSRPAGVGSKRSMVWGSAAVLVALAGGVAGGAALRSRGPTVAPSASVIAVLPFVPAAPDTALTRLGRDLASTVSASLDGVGDIRAVDRLTVLAQTQGGAAPLSLRDGAVLGRRLGATSVVHGSLTRDGARVRLDVGLYTSDSLSALGRGSVLAAPESLSALTDSVVWRLLADIWRHGRPPTPSLEALTTHSVEALRAFLDGEREAVAGRGEAAHAAYGRAIAADSSFWFAYFRQGNVMGWAEGDVDSATEQAYWSHRQLLPERERLMIEAFRAVRLDSGLFRRRAKFEEIVRRYPDYWPGWWALGDMLAHEGGYIGSTAEDTRNALERVVALNPSMVLGWGHLVGAAADQRDTVMEARGLAALDRLQAGRTFLQDEGVDGLLRGRTILALQRRSAASEVMMDSLFQDALKPGQNLFGTLIGLATSGEPAAQIDMNRRLLRHGLPPADARMAAVGMMVAWAMRGAWDSTLVAADQLWATPTDTSGLLGPYRMAVLASFIGAVPASEAVRRRPPPARLVLLHAPPYRAELAWLDGVLAATSRNLAGLTAARRRLRASDAKFATYLDRSLGAFELSLRGDRRSAGAAMAALEWELGDRHTYFPADPLTPHFVLRGIDRTAAAGWLLEGGGDSAEAKRLLNWHRTIASFTHKLPLAPLNYLLQARIEDAQGDTAAARHDYEQFLVCYDLPVPAHRHLVTEARAALARLAGAPEASEAH